MPKLIKPLSDAEIKTAKAGDKDYKLSDGRGLFILIAKTGRKYWKMKYSFNGKQKDLAIGEYPQVTLTQARGERDAAKDDLKRGIDPGLIRASAKTSVIAENSFEGIARAWHKRRSRELSKSHAIRQLQRLENNIFPYLGKMDINEITPRLLLDVLRKVEDRGAVETAHRIQNICSQIFRYAIREGLAEFDITLHLRGAIATPEERHHAAIIDPEEFGNMLRLIDGYQGSFIVKIALQIAPHVFLRPGELRLATWDEINFDKKQWEIPAPRMKMDKPHIVPLSKQVLSLLEELYGFTGKSDYLFPSLRAKGKPISDNTLNAALRTIGYTKDQATTHGFRATARTLLDEELHFKTDFIEHQLAHLVKDPNGTAYNRTKHLKARAIMMQKWSDYLNAIKQVY